MDGRPSLVRVHFVDLTAFDAGKRIPTSAILR